MSQVFTAQAVDGASAPFKHLGRGAALNLYVSGNLGGGRVIVEAQTPDGSAWQPLAGGVITEPGVHVLQAAPLVGRLRLQDASGANLNAWVEADSHQTRTRVGEVSA